MSTPTYALIGRVGHALGNAELTIISGFDGDDSAKLYAQQNRGARFLRRGAEYSSGDPYVCEVVKLDDVLANAGSSRSEFDAAVEDMRAKQAEAERQRIADQKARAEQIKAEKLQAEITERALALKQQHEAEQNKLWLAEAEAEIATATKAAAK